MRIADRNARHVDRKMRVLLREERFDRHFEHAPVDEPDEAQLLAHRDEIARRRDLPVGPHHAQEAFVERRLPVPRLHDRLIGEHEAPLVEGRDDFFTEHQIALARRLTVGRCGIDVERVAPGRLGALQRFFAAQHRFLTRFRTAGQRNEAERDRDRNRPADVLMTDPAIVSRNSAAARAIPSASHSANTMPNLLPPTRPMASSGPMAEARRRLTATITSSAMSKP